MKNKNRKLNREEENKKNEDKEPKKTQIFSHVVKYFCCVDGIFETLRGWKSSEKRVEMKRVTL
jgi:hypothetical protein